MTGSEKSQLERVRLELNGQIEELQKEIEKLQAANSEVQRQRDTLEDEKEDTEKDKQRQVKENERWWVLLKSDSVCHWCSMILKLVIGVLC